MKLITNNKKAFHDYFISDLYEAGIVLEGSEVKSIRGGGASLNDSFVNIKDGEIFLRNAYIKPYENTGAFIPDSRKTRKLLMHQAEIDKLERKIKEKGFSLIPTKMYFKDGCVKVEVGVAKGKKLYDKRETLKEKSIKKDIDRAMRPLR